MSAAYFEIEFEDGNSQTVEFDGEPYTESSGIGSYEYWGQKCYDRGIDYLVCDNCDWDHTLYTDEQNKTIAKFASDNYDRIEFAICENHQEQMRSEYEDRQFEDNRWYSHFD